MDGRDDHSDFAIRADGCINIIKGANAYQGPSFWQSNRVEFIGGHERFYSVIISCVKKKKKVITEI
jgi:hypothetical protein